MANPPPHEKPGGSLRRAGAPAPARAGTAACRAVLMLVLLATAVPAGALAAPRPIPIVAAENFYGDIAQQIGGPDAEVHSILSNPDQDPHLFEISPSVGREVSAAHIVIYSGIDYDPWMAKLLQAVRSPHRRTIVVARLMGKQPGDNPHIWYDPASMLILAKTLAGDLAQADPARTDAYQQRLARFEASMQPILARIAVLRRQFAGTPVTATEPVFGYMFSALGMRVRNMRFQMAVMNNTEPGASDVAAFESDLRTHQVALLVYNSQASDPIAARMRRIASEAARPGGRGDRNRAARRDVPDMDAKRARRGGPRIGEVAVPRANDHDEPAPGRWPTSKKHDAVGQEPKLPLPLWEGVGGRGRSAGLVSTPPPNFLPQGEGKPCLATPPVSSTAAKAIAAQAGAA